MLSRHGPLLTVVPELHLGAGKEARLVISLARSGSVSDKVCGSREGLALLILVRQHGTGLLRLIGSSRCTASSRATCRESDR